MIPSSNPAPPAPALTDPSAIDCRPPCRFNPIQIAADRSGACVVFLLQTDNLSVFPAAAFAERRSPPPFICCRVPHPNQPKHALSTNIPVAYKHGSCRTKKSSEIDRNPNDSERRQTKRLLLFFHCDKNCADRKST